MDSVGNKRMRAESASSSTTQVLALNLLPWNIIARRGEQGGPAALVHRILE